MRHAAAGASVQSEGASAESAQSLCAPPVRPAAPAPVDNTLETLAARSGPAPEQQVWRPVLYDLTRDEQVAAVETLLASGEVRDVHDDIADQLRELVAARDPRKAWPREELDRRVREHLAGCDPRRYGTWVHYPWSRRLVHLLPRDEFREVRADRNRYKITSLEQARLTTFRIGVIGLSVGNMAAVTLALEGIGGTFKLADFDRLSLSNLNRLRGGVHQLGVEKTVLAARELFEIDPWLNVELHREGVQPSTVDEFLVGGGKLDLVVEESDDLCVKVLIREQARIRRIPVVMDTSDRGLLDVERFDREPDRPVLHGLLGDVRAEDLRGMTTKDKVPIVLAILDEEKLSRRMAASLPEIQTTISSWPQLASGVALGGALVADTARRILLGEHTESGRYYVDPADIVTDGKGAFREPAEPPPPFVVTAQARRPRRLPPDPDPVHVASLGPDVVRWIAAIGTLAPSGHNNQPWQLRWRAAERVLECRHDSTRDLAVLDFDHGGTWLAFGALVENIHLAARHLGLETQIRAWPDPTEPRLVCAVELVPGARAETDPLFFEVAKRVTNRRREARVPLADVAATALHETCAAAETRLQLLREPAHLDESAAVLGAGDRICLLDRNLHHDLTHGFRWTPDQVLAQPHGLDVATLEYTPAERAGLRLARQWPVMESLARFGGGRGLEEITRELVAAASAVGLVTIQGTGREGYLRAGRAVQRMWLTATALGLSLQPLTALPYLFARLERGHGDGLSPSTRTELRELRCRYNNLFDTYPDQAEVFLFRIAYAGPPTARSLRRSLDEVLTVT